MLSLSTNTATTATCTLSLHDALPISPNQQQREQATQNKRRQNTRQRDRYSTTEAPTYQIGIKFNANQKHIQHQDRKSTRLNSSHTVISYAVFCLKKKKK